GLDRCLQAGGEQVPLAHESRHGRNPDQGEGRQGEAPHGYRHPPADAPQLIHPGAVGGEDDGARRQEERIL
ncbi:Helix-turn-helix, partial [Dysosmobacter welbionis]